MHVVLVSVTSAQWHLDVTELSISGHSHRRVALHWIGGLCSHRLTKIMHAHPGHAEDGIHLTFLLLYGLLSLSSCLLLHMLQSSHDTKLNDTMQYWMLILKCNHINDMSVIMCWPQPWNYQTLAMCSPTTSKSRLYGVNSYLNVCCSTSEAGAWQCTDSVVMIISK